MSIAENMIARRNEPLGQTFRFIDNPQKTYPPFNVVVDNRDQPTVYTIEMAIAGFGPSDIKVYTKKQDNKTLVIEGKSESTEEKVFVTRGISARAFKREFALSPQVDVSEVKMKDGMLYIQLDVKREPDQVFEIKYES